MRTKRYSRCTSAPEPHHPPGDDVGAGALPDERGVVGSGFGDLRVLELKFVDLGLGIPRRHLGVQEPDGLREETPHQRAQPDPARPWRRNGFHGLPGEARFGKMSGPRARPQERAVAEPGTQPRQGAVGRVVVPGGGAVEKLALPDVGRGAPHFHDDFRHPGRQRRGLHAEPQQVQDLRPVQGGPGRPQGLCPV